MIFYGVSAMDSCSGNFLGSYRQVSPSAFVAAEQVLSQLPGGWLLHRLLQAIAETFADQLGFGNPLGFSQ